jgi:putative lipoic acid-binding regulatory protein
MSREDDRARALALLESRHTFPGAFAFRAVVRAHAVSTVVSALSATLARPARVDRRESSGGRWVSFHYEVQVSSAEEVLEVYAFLQGMPEVAVSL